MRKKEKGVKFIFKHLLNLQSWPRWLFPYSRAIIILYTTSIAYTWTNNKCLKSGATEDSSIINAQLHYSIEDAKTFKFHTQHINWSMHGIASNVYKDTVCRYVVSFVMKFREDSLSQ